MVHRAGEVIDGVQRCERCGVVLVDYERAQQLGSNADGYAGELYFPPGSYVDQDGDRLSRVELVGSTCESYTYGPGPAEAMKLRESLHSEALNVQRGRR